MEFTVFFPYAVSYFIQLVKHRVSENVLGAVKIEFGKFGEALAHTRKRLEEASSSIDETAARTRVMGRKLQQFEAWPVNEAIAVLALDLSDVEDSPL